MGGNLGRYLSASRFSQYGRDHMVLRSSDQMWFVSVRSKSGQAKGFWTRDRPLRQRLYGMYLIQRPHWSTRVTAAIPFILRFDSANWSILDRCPPKGVVANGASMGGPPSQFPGTNSMRTRVHFNTSQKLSSRRTKSPLTDWFSQPGKLALQSTVLTSEKISQKRHDARKLYVV